MFEYAAEGLMLLVSEWWIVPLGVLLGMAIGATPGLTSSNALPILLPIIFIMSPVRGLIFIIAIYCGAEMGNSFPAVLLNIPGNASAVVSSYDGYPLTVKGLAAKALGICVLGSMLGAILGGVATIFFGPFIANFALMFSGVEMTIVILFGIAVLGQVSAGSLAKGLVAGFFGLLLATTGTDPMWGQFRGTFGMIHLLDGFPVIPVLIGSLALSEMIIMVENINAKKEKQDNNVQIKVGLKGIIEGFKEVIIRPFQVLRAAVIGIIAGAIPGAGSSIASFISYQQAAAYATPKEKELFGKGSPSGLLAADVANNAMVGGGLIPTFTLGIPGSGAMAVVLVAMYYHGLVIGPRFFELNGEIAFAVLWSQFFAGLMVGLIGTGLAYFVYKVAYLKQSVIIPVVTILALLGGFASRGVVFDVGLVLIFGAIGYIMKKTGYPPVALVLGVILGRILEFNVFRGLKMGFGSPAVFFSTPLAIGLWVLLILTFVLPPVIKYYSDKNAKENEQEIE